MSNNKKSIKEFVKNNGFYILTGVTLIAVVVTVAIPKKKDNKSKEEPNNYAISKAETEESINDLRSPTIDADLEDDFIVESDEEEENEPTFNHDQEESLESSDTQVAKAEEKEEELVAETFSTTTSDAEDLFHPDDEMFAWPIDSEVIHKYSDNDEGNSFMNPTLDRTMRSFGLILESKEDNKVMAAAKGKVVAIGQYPESNITEKMDFPRVGTAVTIDHGNEWSSVYGLHEGDALVKVGDLVELGQEIGNVGAPSKDFKLTGDNLYFQVLKDEVPVNPEEKLTK